ncbi:hypothetical protein AAAC07_01370 [Pseudomonas aeruginosa]
MAGNQGVDITARQVDNSVGEIASQGVVALNLTEQLDNRGGKIVGDSGLGITAPHVLNQDKGYSPAAMGCA